MLGLKWLKRLNARAGVALSSTQLQEALDSIRIEIASTEQELSRHLDAIPEHEPASADADDELLIKLEARLRALKLKAAAYEEALAEAREIEAEAALKLRSEEAAARRAARREIAERLDAAVDMVATITMELHAAGIHASNLNQLGPAIASTLYGKNGGQDRHRRRRGRACPGLFAPGLPRNSRLRDHTKRQEDRKWSTNQKNQ